MVKHQVQTGRKALKPDLQPMEKSVLFGYVNQSQFTKWKCGSCF